MFFYMFLQNPGNCGKCEFIEIIHKMQHKSRETYVLRL